ncbi:MAG: hypothetical protein EA001_16635 [Oscillatoriales cyanobacterium]|nr:MAG: hypothetical protein EA001_16635 [Oscillatoriales cyanobacterium]
MRSLSEYESSFLKQLDRIVSGAIEQQQAAGSDKSQQSPQGDRSIRSTAPHQCHQHPNKKRRVVNDDRRFNCAECVLRA